MRQINPEDKAQLLALLFELLGLSGNGLEALLSRPNFQDSALMLTRLVELSGQICMVSIEGQPKGTGFLVGPDLLLTNYHVAMPFIQDPAKAAQVRLHFDFSSAQGGGDPNQAGTVLGLSLGNPVLHYSQYDQVDVDLNIPPTTPVPVDKLDYALLRLERAVGKEPGSLSLAGPGQAGAQQRGWLRYPDPMPPLLPGEPLCILQHPYGKPLKIAQENDAIIGFDPNKVRLRYKVNTDGGSSGSPCFNERWQWVALHHYGHLARDYNQGVPVDKIIAALPPSLRAELSPERAAAPPPPVAAAAKAKPGGKVVLHEDRVFVGREELKTTISAKIERKQSWVLHLVGQQARTGVSYCYYYFKHWAAQEQGLKVVEINIAALYEVKQMDMEGQPPALERRLEPINLIEEINNQMRLGIKLSEQEFKISSFRGQFIAELDARKQERYVLFIDHFTKDRDLLTDTAKSFINGLVGYTRNLSNLSIATSFPELNAPADANVIKIVLKAFEQQDLQDFLQKLYEQMPLITGRPNVDDEATFVQNGMAWLEPALTESPNVEAVGRDALDFLNTILETPPAT